MHNIRRAALAPDQSRLAMQMPTAPRTRWVRHVTVCALMACAMLAVMRWWSWAWAPASIAAILYLMYASIDMAESRARTFRDLSTSGPRPDTHSALVARERIGARILATLLIGTASMALVVAALVLDSRTLGVGTATAFGAVIFVGLPTWTAVVGGRMRHDRS